MKLPFRKQREEDPCLGCEELGVPSVDNVREAGNTGRKEPNKEEEYEVHTPEEWRSHGGA